jgi:hypothetical protein
MKNSELVKKAMAQLESDDPARAAGYFSSDFQFHGSMPKPLDFHQMSDLIMAILRAFPDWRMQFTLLSEEGDVVRGMVEPRGTHTGKELRLPGIAPVPATGVSVILARSPVEFVIHDGEISQMRMEMASGAGIPGILEQLGLEVEATLPQLLEDK